MAGQGTDGPSPSDVILNNLHYTFDPSLGLIFPTLASGARMVLAEPGEEYDPHRLLERVARWKA